MGFKRRAAAGNTTVDHGTPGYAARRGWRRHGEIISVDPVFARFWLERRSARVASSGGGRNIARRRKSGGRSPGPRQTPVGPPSVVRLERRPWRERVLEWLGEIVIVFVGVYAAFLLNAWQAQRLDRSHHLQILQSLDEQLSESVRQAREVVTRNQKTFDEFQRALAAGEMPKPHLIAFSTDYDPADDVALSQAGADHLLNFKTVEALKQASSVERQGLMMLRNNQQLSYELIAPGVWMTPGRRFTIRKPGS